MKINKTIFINLISNLLNILYVKSLLALTIPSNIPSQAPFPATIEYYDYNTYYNKYVLVTFYFENAFRAYCQDSKYVKILGWYSYENDREHTAGYSEAYYDHSSESFTIGKFNRYGHDLGDTTYTIEQAELGCMYDKIIWIDYFSASKESSSFLGFFKNIINSSASRPAGCYAVGAYVIPSQSFISSEDQLLGNTKKYFNLNELNFGFQLSPKINTKNIDFSPLPVSSKDSKYVEYMGKAQWINPQCFWKPWEPQKNKSNNYNFFGFIKSLFF